MIVYSFKFVSAIHFITTHAYCVYLRLHAMFVVKKNTWTVLGSAKDLFDIGTIEEAYLKSLKHAWAFSESVEEPCSKQSLLSYNLDNCRSNYVELGSFVMSLLS